MRGRMRGVGPALAALLFAIALLQGCGLFKPTEPETPSGTVVRTDYSSPDSTLETLARAVEDKGSSTGLTAYLGGLADQSRDGIGFVAIPLESVVQALQVSDQTWTESNESGFYSRLAKINASPYLMTWEPDTRFNPDDVNGDDAVLYRRYTILTPQNRLIARGYAKLVMKQLNGSKWVVVTWEEQVVEPGDDEALTFSWLRLLS